MRIAVIIAAVSVTMAGPGLAQLPTARGGGLSGLLGGLPNVGSATAGNAAGLLGYCVKNNLLSGANASTVLGNLSNKPGVAATPGYSAGQAGTLQTGNSTLSLDDLKGKVKTQVCNLVLKRAKSFL